MTPLELYRLGIAVFPVRFLSKQPAVKWSSYQTQLPAEHDVLRWFRPGAITNAAAVCGYHAALTVLDFDTATGYGAWFAWATEHGGRAAEATESYRVETSRGMHVYLIVRDRPRTTKLWRSTTEREAFHEVKKQDPKLEIESALGCWGDVKGAGGYVLIPPSVHPTGVPYLTINDGAPIITVDTLADVIPAPPVLRQHVVIPGVTIGPNPAVASVYGETLIERIKRTRSVLEFFPGATGQGRWRMTKCPWHDHASNRTSLRIDVQENVVYCFAGCTPRGLSVIDVCATLRSFTVKQALRELSGPPGLPWVAPPTTAVQRYP